MYGGGAKVRSRGHLAHPRRPGARAQTTHVVVVGSIYAPAATTTRGAIDAHIVTTATD